MPTWAIKECQDVLINPITKICNTTLRHLVDEHAPLRTTTIAMVQ